MRTYVVMLSRGTHSTIQQRLPTADHETRLALAFAQRVNITIENNLQGLR